MSTQPTIWVKLTNKCYVKQIRYTSPYLIPFVERSERSKMSNGDKSQHSVYSSAKWSQWQKGHEWGFLVLEMFRFLIWELVTWHYLLSEIGHAMHLWFVHSLVGILFFNKLHQNIEHLQSNNRFLSPWPLLCVGLVNCSSYLSPQHLVRMLVPPTLHVSTMAANLRTHLSCALCPV